MQTRCITPVFASNTKIPDMCCCGLQPARHTLCRESTRQKTCRDMMMRMMGILHVFASFQNHTITITCCRPAMPGDGKSPIKKSKCVLHEEVYISQQPGDVFLLFSHGSKHFAASYIHTRSCNPRRNMTWVRTRGATPHCHTPSINRKTQQ